MGMREYHGFYHWGMAGIFNCPKCQGQLSIIIEAPLFRTGRKDKRPKECTCRIPEESMELLKQAAKEFIDTLPWGVKADDVKNESSG
jgi:hypothetical protein